MAGNRQSLAQKTKQANVEIRLCEIYAFPELCKDGEECLESINRQKQAIANIRAERGQIAEFPANARTDEVDVRRKRSAIRKGEITQLPFVAKDQVACPHVAIRSALFGIRSRGRSYEKLQNAPIAFEGPGTISFSGFKLGQKDLSVWLHCLDLCRDSVGAEVIISVYALNQRMGLADSSSNAKTLLASLRRLSLSRVFFHKINDEPAVERQLLSFWKFFDPDKQILCISIDPEWSDQFGTACWTKLSAKLRASLNGKEFALWLATYMSSHNGKVPLKISTLHSLSGATSSLREFRRLVKRALTDLKAVGFATQAEIKDNAIRDFKK